MCKRRNTVLRCYITRNVLTIVIIRFGSVILVINLGSEFQNYKIQKLQKSLKPKIVELKSIKTGGWIRKKIDIKQSENELYLMHTEIHHNSGITIIF